ncbi:MAG TPA: hypothetical protein VGW11_05520 [Solirubrobacteraceae bacterium]|nr:hypothetical protein [Solirubrobacteraceae bacterium]
MRRALLFVPLIAVAALAVGCGAERTPVPDASRPGPPFGFEPVTLGDSGVALDAPRGWRYREPGAPQLVNIFTGTAVISVWRYPRSEPLPSSPEQLEAALENLLAAARARDPDVLVLDEGVVELDGQPAVAVMVSTEIAGRRRTVQSVHAYAFGAEVVVDAYAGPREFFRVNKQTFLPVLRSIELSEPEPQT